MATSISIKSGGLTEAQVLALINANPTPAQPLKSATPPTGLAIGDEYFNTTDGKKYVLTASGFKVIDLTEDLIIQDLSGNVIGTD